MTKHKVGAHVSASGGLDKAVERAHEMGANCAQIFSASPRIWRKPKLESFDTSKLFETQKKQVVSPIVTHALYLVNLASDNPEQVKKSIDALIFELSFDSLIHGGGVVVHLGSHQGRGWESSKEQVAQAISSILQNTPDDSHFLIENSAGQNGKLSSDLSEVRWLLDTVKSKRLKWCVDTCHSFSAGYLLSPHSKYKDEHHKTLEEVISDLELWETLACVHVNDSRDPFDSGKDRHENLNDGSIPAEDFEHFLQLKQLETIPFILEVPGIDKTGPDAQNISRLKKLLGE